MAKKKTDRPVAKPVVHAKKRNGVAQRAPVIRRAWLSDNAERKMVRSRKMFLETLSKRIARVSAEQPTPSYRADVLRVVAKAMERYEGQ